MRSSGPPALEVLLVEDSPGDVRLTQEALREANPRIRMHVACDGVEAMAFLRREGEHVHAPRPDLIAGSEPAEDGWPRGPGTHQGRRQLRTIPTIVLTTSESEADIVKSTSSRRTASSASPSSWRHSRA